MKNNRDSTMYKDRLCEAGYLWYGLTPFDIFFNNQGQAVYVSFDEDQNQIPLNVLFGNRFF